MPPGRWTALFFLDEATALAAGHRPCAYCRRRDFVAFAAAWRAGHGLPHRPRAPQIDGWLHLERIVPRSRHQLTRPALAGDLPDGVMVRHGGTVGLLLEGSVRPWSFTGYGDPIALLSSTTVELLTPPSAAAAIRAGYSPLLHSSVTPSGG